MAKISISDAANIVTAIATGVTAALVLLDFRVKNKPVVKVYLDRDQPGMLIARFVIVPAAVPTRVVRISTRKPILSDLKWETGSNGRYFAKRTHDALVSSLPMSVDIDSSRYSSEPVQVRIFIDATNADSSEILFKLRCRRRLVPYTLTASIRTKR